MPVNVKTSSPHAYEQLSVVIDAFEQHALKSGKREGILLVSNSPLSAMDEILASSERNLQAIRSSRQATQTRSGDTDVQTWSNDDGSIEVAHSCVDVNVTTAAESDSGVPEVVVTGGLRMDADLMELMGDSALKQALEDCYECDLRLSFDWQLKPLDLLGPIAEMLAEINAAMDTIDGMLDPFANLEGFCAGMNNFSLICIQDWVSIIVSLKMLLQKYLIQSIKMTFDWTVLLGPLLQIIVEAVVSLINQAGAVLTGPLDCAIDTLSSLSDLEREARDLVATTAGLANAVGNTASGAGGGIFDEDIFTLLEKDIDWNKEDDEATGTLSATTRSASAEASGNTDFSFLSGMNLEKDKNFIDDLGSSDFQNKNLTGQIERTVREAKSNIDKLINDLNQSLESVNNLVGGGLKIQIGGLAAMLFISDMINMVMVIINLLNSGANPSDWCQYFDENPDALDEQFARRMGIRVARSKENTLVFSKGPQVREFSTCLNETSEVDSSVLSAWIADLNKGSV